MGEKAVGEMGEKSLWVTNIWLKSLRVKNIYSMGKNALGE